MNICIYGAASEQISPVFLQAGQSLGRALAQRGHRMVFGGGATGMMGALARGVSSANGQILGVAPHFFDAEGVLYGGCTEFIFTKTMRERKQIMEDRADAFVMTPGGIGTFEEFFEILTLKQLGQHMKPIAVYNIEGYFDHMVAMLQKAVDAHFMEAKVLSMFETFVQPEPLLDALAQAIENNQAETVDHCKGK